MNSSKKQTDQGGATGVRLSDEDLHGRTVISADGQVIGEVAALFFDSGAWRVESLQVKLHKEIADQLGVDRNVFRAGALEIPVRMVQAVGAAVVLSIPVDGLREVLRDETEIPSTVPKGDDAHP